MKRKLAGVFTALGALSGLTFLWIDSVVPNGLTHDQGVAAAVTSGVCLLSGALCYE